MTWLYLYKILQNLWKLLELFNEFSKVIQDQYTKINYISTDSTKHLKMKMSFTVA